MRIPLISLLLLALASGRLLHAGEPSPSEGTFEGQPASHWIAQLAAEDVPARQTAAYALFQLGPGVAAAAEPLARAIGDEDAYVQDTAYKALVAMKSLARPATGILRSWLDDGRARVRDLALWALLRVDPAVAFRDEDVDVRKAAIAAVINPSEFLDETVFGELIGRLGDEEAELRSLAANALGNAYIRPGRQEAWRVASKVSVVETLQHLAQSDEEAVARQWSVYALGWIAKYEEGPSLGDVILLSLLAATRDEAADVRGQAFIALGGVGQKRADVEAAFVKGLEDSGPKVRAAASYWISSVSSGGPPVVTALLAVLDDEAVEVRRGAVRSLGALGESAERAVPFLIARLRVEENAYVRALLAAALGDIGAASSPALPLLEEAFRTDVEASAALAYALVRLESEVRADALKRLVDVALSDVGGQAMAWVGQLGEAAVPAIPQLVDALTQGEGATRLRAAWTLRGMGRTAHAAVPALEALAKPDAGVDEELAAAAREALDAIAPD